MSFKNPYEFIPAPRVRVGDRKETQVTMETTDQERDQRMDTLRETERQAMEAYLSSVSGPPCTATMHSKCPHYLASVAWEAARAALLLEVSL